LIVEPDILLLDEPTNNLDTNGINHLKELIMATEQTCVVISHDEEFLNSFSDSVLYLDVFSKKVEQYEGERETVTAVDPLMYVSLKQLRYCHPFELEYLRKANSNVS
jgi:ATPase subunit of ABC transporter with duplicated ATPase domains